MTKPTKDNNDDVLDFINSLPDSKPGTPKPSKTSGSNTGGGNDSTENKEDLLDFWMNWNNMKRPKDQNHLN